MIEIHQLAPRWGRVREFLEEGRSVIVHAPHSFGRRSFAQSIMTAAAADSDTRCIHLNANECSDGAVLDYSELCQASARQLGTRGRKAMKEQSSYCTWFRDLLVRRRQGRVVVLASGGGRGHERPQFELVTTFHSILGSLPKDGSRLAVCVLDDFSLYYYETWKTQDVSRWDHFAEGVKHGFISEDESVELLQKLASSATAGTRLSPTLAHRLHRLTGGHPALSREVLLDIAVRDSEILEDYWRTTGPILRASNVLDPLRRALVEDPVDLCREALKFVEPKPAVHDQSSPELQLLRQLGIVQWVSQVTAVLCPGVIRGLVRDLAVRQDDFLGRGKASRRRSRDPALLSSIDGDDLVTIHLSDLHVGKRYPFRLPGMEGIENRGVRSAADLLRKDLQSLGLLGRLDAIVISGDFTDEGRAEEFRAARHVVEEILEAACLGAGELLILAGNHDIDWGPQKPDLPDPDTGVCRDNYADFQELLSKGRRRDPRADLLTVPSRNGRRMLRLVSLDSNFIESKSASGIGFVAPDSFDHALALLEKSRKENAEKELLTWIVVHHHVFPVSSLPAKYAFGNRVSVMANAVDLLDFAGQCGAEAILHGHQHEPAITIATRWVHDWTGEPSPVVALGAGSFSVDASDLGPLKRNHYFILQRRLNELVVHSRVLGENALAFVTHGSLAVPR
jgi:3',5'-cyclic AMP phosphodiesterase CpdA